MTMTGTPPLGSSEVPEPRPDVRAVVIDDHRLLAQSLAVALGFEGVSCTVADLDDRDTVVRRILADPPTLVLLDLDLGPVMGDGSRLVETFVAAGSRVLVVSASIDPEQVGRALEAGAEGVVPKEAPFEALVAAALAAAHGETVMPAKERTRIVEAGRRVRALRAPFDRLSEREAEVLRALAAGTRASTLAEQWHVSVATIRTQIRAVLTKLGVSSQLEAIALAQKCGWLS